MPLDLHTADLLDANEAEARRGSIRILAPGFRHYGGRRAFCGAIVTLKTFEDNSLVRTTLAGPGHGSVLVVDGGGSLGCALVGDQLAQLGVNNGWSGIVVNGCIRDSQAIATMSIGMLALATHPLKSVKRNAGEMNVAVTVGGITCSPGEWFCADEDGAIVSTSPLV